MTATLHAPPETKDETIALGDDRERVRATTFVWMTPAAILLIGLFLIPTIYAIYLGFTNLQLLGPHAQNYSFTGLANFNRLVNDPVFWYSVKLTLIFVIVSGIIAQTLLGLGLALLGQRAHFTVRASVGSVVILAWVLPEIAVAFIWYSFGQAGGLLSEIVGRPSDDLLASPAPAHRMCGERVAGHGFLHAHPLRGTAQRTPGGR